MALREVDFSIFQKLREHFNNESNQFDVLFEQGWVSVLSDIKDHQSKELLAALLVWRLRKDNQYKDLSLVIKEKFQIYEEIGIDFTKEGPQDVTIRRLITGIVFNKVKV